MKKKAFTLIELLVVIILLGIIALISTPIIINVLKESRKSTGLSEATLIYNEINKYCDTEEIHENSNYQEICNVNLQKEDVNKIVKLGNAKVLNIKFEGEVKLLRIKSNDNIYILNNDKMIHLEELKETPMNCFTIQEKDGKKSINSYDETCGTDVVIPDDIKIINYNAFSRKQLTSIKLNEGLEEIGSFSFTDNQLTDIIFPNTLKKIGYSAFSDNQLINIKLPDSLVSIDGAAFKNNQIINLIIPNSISTIKSNTFNNNQINSLELPNSIEVIEGVSFYNNQIKKIKLSNNLKKIDPLAFCNNQIENLIIPESVEILGNFAFGNNQISNLEIKSTNLYMPNGSAFRNNQLPDSQAFIYARKDGKEDKTNLIDYGGKNKEKIILPEGIKILGTNVFRGYKIQDIKLPSSLVSIGDWALSGNQLTNISIPNSVTLIGEAAFNGNKLSDSQAFIYARKDGKEDKTTLISYGGINKDNVIVPETVTNIGINAFRQSSLKSLIIPSNVQNIGEWSLADNDFTKIVNKTGRIIDWGPVILGYNYGKYEFETGRINVRNVDVLITKE